MFIIDINDDDDDDDDDMMLSIPWHNNLPKVGYAKQNSSSFP